MDDLFGGDALDVLMPSLERQVEAAAASRNAKTTTPKTPRLTAKFVNDMGAEHDRTKVLSPNKVQKRTQQAKTVKVVVKDNAKGVEGVKTGAVVQCVEKPKKAGVTDKLIVGKRGSVETSDPGVPISCDKATVSDAMIIALLDRYDCTTLEPKASALLKSRFDQVVHRWNARLGRMRFHCFPGVK